MGLQNIDTSDDQGQEQEEKTKAEKAKERSDQTTLTDPVTMDGAPEPVIDSRWEEAEFLPLQNKYGEAVTGLPPDVRGSHHYDPPELLDWQDGWYDATSLVVMEGTGEAKTMPCRCERNHTVLPQQRAVMCPDCRSVVVDPQWFKRGVSIVNVDDSDLIDGCILRASHTHLTSYRVIHQEEDIQVTFKEIGDDWYINFYRENGTGAESEFPSFDDQVKQVRSVECKDEGKIPPEVVEDVNETIQELLNDGTR